MRIKGINYDTGKNVFTVGGAASRAPVAMVPGRCV